MGYEVTFTEEAERAYNLLMKLPRCDRIYVLQKILEDEPGDLVKEGPLERECADILDDSD